VAVAVVVSVVVKMELAVTGGVPFGPPNEIKMGHLPDHCHLLQQFQCNYENLPAVNLFPFFYIRH
jgi:hypothetical protein